MLTRTVSLLSCLSALILVCQPVVGMETGSAEEALENSTYESLQENVDPSENANLDVIPGSHLINSLLVDKDIPLFGGKWSGELFVDAPLNGEPVDSSVTLRRARLKYSRSSGNNWQFTLSADYQDQAGLELNDSYFVYKGWKTARVTIGIDDPPFSLESVSSSAGLTFMERALAVAALSERKGGGVTFLKRTANSILNADFVLFSTNMDDLRDSGQALVLHYVHSPIRLRNKDNIHLGGSISYRINANEDNTQFRSRPEVNTTSAYFVDTGTIGGADKIIRTSLEANRVSGRLSWQTELLSTRVQRVGMDDVRFWGAYAYVSWFLTNDSRNYNDGDGTFGELTPSSAVFKGGKGAFELAFRVSYIDLTDADVKGGEESNLSLGFNWYLNDKLRVMTNVVKVLDVKRPGSEYDGQNPLIFALRAQWLMN